MLLMFLDAIKNRCFANNSLSYESDYRQSLKMEMDLRELNYIHEQDFITSLGSSKRKTKRKKRNYTSDQVELPGA